MLGIRFLPTIVIVFQVYHLLAQRIVLTQAIRQRRTIANVFSQQQDHIKTKTIPLSLDSNSKSSGDKTTDKSEDEPTKRSFSHSNDKFDSILYPDKRLFVVEFLKMLHEQHGIKEASIQTTSTTTTTTSTRPIDFGVGGGEDDDKYNDSADSSNNNSGHNGTEVDRQSASQTTREKSIMRQLLAAIDADGDSRRLLDWVQNWLNTASLGELTTQFVVSKLGSVNCAALLRPNSEETLIPRFLLFNENFVDVPYELQLGAFNSKECLANAHFDPERKTVLLIHGYLTGYTLLDGLTNIKNRLLDFNKIINTRAAITLAALRKNRRQRHAYENETIDGSTSSDLVADELELRIRQQLYNVIIVDWFNGANPIPRSNYIRAAVNAPVVGKLIAHFLVELTEKCATQSDRIQIIAHSLGCHVAGFAGKAMNSAGKRLGKIVHLDPVGLCFGRLFSQPQFRLSPDDAIDTQAVHVSLNLFDNPLDGAQGNFLVNGGRDQIGCGGMSELKNSTSSSISILVDSDAKFNPCSHMRALSLFEDDLSSEPGQCQIVGHRCSSYASFLAGKCGKCDAQNRQCRLMSLPPLKIPRPPRPVILAQPRLPQLPLMSPLPDSTTVPSITTTTTTMTTASTASPQLQLEHVPIRKKLTTQRIIMPILNGYEDQKLGEASALLRHLQQQLTRGNQVNNGFTQLGPVENLLSTIEEAAYLLKENNLKRLDAADNNGTNAFSGQQKYVELRVTGTESGEAGEMSQLASDQSGRSYAPVETTTDQSIKSNFGSRIKRSAGIDEEQVDSSNEDGARSEVNSEEHPTLHTQSAQLLSSRSKRRLTEDQRERIVLAIHKIRTDARNAIADGWSSIKNGDARYKVSTLIRPLQLGALPSLPSISVDSESLQSLFTGASNNVGTQEQGASEASGDLDLSESVLVPLGGQAIPDGSTIGPLYYVGTGPVSPYCVNYYQFRMIFPESRIKRFLEVAAGRQSQPNNVATSNRSHRTQALPQLSRQPTLNSYSLHLSIKLNDNRGYFFKGFTLMDDVRSLARVKPESEGYKSGENIFQLTMLLNTTKFEPIRVGRSIVSFYFHKILLADRIEVNYMSNISPEIRARYSSSLCPVAINEEQKLVRYVECSKV